MISRFWILGFLFFEVGFLGVGLLFVVCCLLLQRVARVGGVAATANVGVVGFCTFAKSAPMRFFVAKVWAFALPPFLF